MSPGAPPHLRSTALARVRHGFFGREGGVSTGVYASLNAGTGSDDDPASVAENRRRIAAAFDAAALVGVHQVHSPRAVFVEQPWPGERPHADALVTTRPGLVISVLTADCAPVLLADAEAGVIGAAHAGWRGALGGVLEATVELMCAHGAERERITAAVGPAIAQSSYEVGPEFEAAFTEADPGNGRLFAARSGGRAHFNLPGYCTLRLARLGLPFVDDLRRDTYAEPARFFSCRRSAHEKLGDYGRNCAAIAL